MPYQFLSVIFPTMERVLNLVQLLNACCPIEVMDTIPEMEETVESAKAKVPITVTEDGIDILLILAPENAELGISVKPSDKTTSTSE